MVHSGGHSIHSPRTFYLLRTVERMVRQRVKEKVTPFNLTEGEYLILSLANRFASLSAAQMARKVMATPQAIGEVIASLEQKGLIQRLEDEENQRILRIHLTKEGKRVVQLCEKEIEKLGDEFFSQISLAEYIVFHDVLQKLVDQGHVK